MERSGKNLGILINSSPENVINIIRENLVSSGIILFPFKKPFGGIINTTSFKLYQLKKYSFFDYNSVKVEGEINGNSEETKIIARFSLIGIYKYALHFMALLFFFLDYWIWTSGSEIHDLFVLIAIELVVLLMLLIQNLVRFKRDKERFIETFQSIFKESKVSFYSKSS